MRPRAITTGLVWLALVAMAAEGLGAAALVDACRCQACECGQSVKGQSCCVNRGAPKAVSDCGQSCCGKSAEDCVRATSTLGSCCCRGAEFPTPLNSQKSEPSNPEKPLPAVMPATVLVAVSLPQTCGVYEIGSRFESPPPRILYCVWRN